MDPWTEWPTVYWPLDVGFTAGGGWIAVRDGVDVATVTVWAASNPEDDQPITTAGEAVWAMALSPADLDLAMAERDGTIRLCSLGDTCTEERILVHGDGWSAQSDEVRAMAYSEDGTRLATVENEGVVRVWAVDEGS